MKPLAQVRKSLTEEGERAAVELQVSRLVAVEVLGRQPGRGPRRMSHGRADAGLPLVGDHLPPRHLNRPPEAEDE